MIFIYFEKLNSIYPETLTFAVLPPDIDYLENNRKNDDLLFDKTSDCFCKTLEDVRNILCEITKEYKNVVLLNAKDFISNHTEAFYEDNIHLNDFGNVLYGQKLASLISEHF